MYLSTDFAAIQRLTFSSMALLLALGGTVASADSYIVSDFGDTGAGSNSFGDLRYCITQANAHPGSTIYLLGAGTITLQSRLPLITSAMTFDGLAAANVTISGNDQNRVFFVDAPGQAVTFAGFTIANGSAIGGAGGLGGGGGGAGMGGALFVNAGSVLIDRVNFTGNSAIGGAGGDASGEGGGGGGGAHGAGGVGFYGGGGGGFGGNGGNAGIGGGGGGGLIGNGGDGDDNLGSGGGGGGLTAGENGQGSVGGGGGDAGGNGGIADPYTSATAGALYGGGGGGGTGSYNADKSGKNGGNYGGGGGAGTAGSTAPGTLNGGSGGDFGGGGGNGTITGGVAGGGGFGGGGGGGAPHHTQFGSAHAGSGGFGGGGGGAFLQSRSKPGGAFGGGGGYATHPSAGHGAGGGGGAGLGGAIFVRAANGASLTIAESGFSGSSVTGGAGGFNSSNPSYITPAGNGQAVGSDLFLHGGTTTLRVSSGTRSMSGSIVDAAVVGAAGAAGIAKTGAGTLSLSGANDYSGGTAINEGTLELASAGAIGTTGAITFGGGTLRFTAGNTTDYSPRFSTAAGQQYRLDTNGILIVLDTPLTSPGGSLTKLGAGPLILTGNNTYTGGTTISGGTLQIGGGGTSGSLVGNVTNNGTLIVYRGDAVSLDGVISGTGKLEQRGTGTLTLTGANNYSGGTIVTAGTLGIGHDTALGTGPVTMAGGGIRAVSSQRTVGNDLLINGSFALGRLTNFTGPVTLGADVIITSTNPDVANPATSTFSGVISGAHRLTFAAGANPIGAIVLSGANTYSGGTTITGGVLSINADAALGTGSLTLNGGTLRNTGNIISSRAVTLGAGGGTLEGGGGFLTFNNPLSGPGGLTKTGGNYLTLIGAQTYAGATSIQGGILKVQDGSLASSSVSIGAGATLLFAINGSTAADISGPGALAREFSGATILTGDATHTGGTTVLGGTLIVSGSILGSATTVKDGATLGGNGSVATLTIESGGNLAPGNSPGTLSTGTFNLQSGAHLKLELGGTGVGQSDRVNVTGAVSLAGDMQISLFGGFVPQIGDKFFAILNDGLDPISGSFSNDNAMQRITIDGATFAVNYADNFGGSGVGNDVSLTMVAIPEPGNVLLLSLGLGIFGLRRRR